MTLLEWYYEAATGGSFPQTTVLGVSQWKAKFVSAGVDATGSSTVTTETEITFTNDVDDGLANDIRATTTTTSTNAFSQQYPAGNGNSYFSPLVGNRVEEIQVYIQNAAAVSGNYAIFAVEIDLEGNFDE